VKLSSLMVARFSVEAPRKKDEMEEVVPRDVSCLHAHRPPGVGVLRLAMEV
jgi:hypothetical protein